MVRIVHEPLQGSSSYRHTFVYCTTYLVRVTIFIKTIMLRVTASCSLEEPKTGRKMLPQDAKTNCNPYMVYRGTSKPPFTVYNKAYSVPALFRIGDILEMAV